MTMVVMVVVVTKVVALEEIEKAAVVTIEKVVVVVEKVEFYGKGVMSKVLQDFAAFCAICWVLTFFIMG